MPEDQAAFLAALLLLLLLLLAGPLVVLLMGLQQLLLQAEVDGQLLRFPLLVQQVSACV
jgi:hypothetical protein